MTSEPQVLLLADRHPSYRISFAFTRILLLRCAGSASSYSWICCEVCRLNCFVEMQCARHNGSMLRSGERYGEKLIRKTRLELGANTFQGALVVFPASHGRHKLHFQLVTALHLFSQILHLLLQLPALHQKLHVPTDTSTSKSNPICLLPNRMNMHRRGRDKRNAAPEEATKKIVARVRVCLRVCKV